MHLPTTHSLCSACVLASIVLIMGCLDSKVPKQALNPNGETELALLMRTMYENSLVITEQIRAGGALSELEVNYEMKTVKATEPEKAGSPAYQHMADVYLETVNYYNAAPPSEKRESFIAVVDQCMTCHRSICPGPTVRIKNLYPETLLDAD